MPRDMPEWDTEARCGGLCGGLCQNEELVQGQVRQALALCWAALWCSTDPAGVAPLQPGHLHIAGPWHQEGDWW